MCIFSQPVTSVNNTQIFSRLTSVGTQILAYQMNYDSRVENAMILPIPIEKPVKKESLRFIDLKDYSEIFEDFLDGFPFRSPPIQIGCSSPPTDSKGNLEVFKVGNYVASFVPGLADFSRLDSRFVLPETTWKKIPSYQDFGFAVFQLAAGSVKPHPMAFEFKTAIDSIYFPTMHIHDGQVHTKEEFDHVLYMQHAGLDSKVYGYRNPRVPDKSTGLIRSKQVAKKFCDMSRCDDIIDGDLLIHRKFLYGKLANRDTEFTVTGDPEKRTLNLKPLLPYVPWVFCVAAVGWFIARRAKIKKRESLAESRGKSKGP